VIENKNCEGTDCLKAAFTSGMTTLGVMVASARSVGWRRKEAVSFLYLVPYPSALMCSMETHGSETFLIKRTDQYLHLHSR